MKYKTFLTELKLTVKYNKTLNPVMWDKDGQLIPSVKRAIFLRISDFMQFSGIDMSNVVDIIFTGSSANYNYTKYSDIDIHILGKDMKPSSDEIYDAKVKWTADHETECKYMGYHIEYYIQPYDETIPPGQGVYSLLQNKWLVLPIHMDIMPETLTDPNTIVKLEHNIKYIKSLIKNGTLDNINKYKTKLHNMRSAGLERAGEFSIENVIYKDMRNRGLIDKLNAKKLALTDK